MVLSAWMPHDTQTGEASYGRDSGRSESILILSSQSYPIYHLSSIIQDMDPYQPGGVYYGVDICWAEYEMDLKPQDRHQAEYPLGGILDGLS